MLSAVVPVLARSDTVLWEPQPIGDRRPFIGSLNGRPEGRPCTCGSAVEQLRSAVQSELDSSAAIEPGGRSITEAPDVGAGIQVVAPVRGGTAIQKKGEFGPVLVTGITWL